MKREFVFSKAKIDEVNKVFRSYDVDQRTVITFRDALRAMHDLHLYPTAEEMVHIFELLSADSRNGCVVTLPEFFHALIPMFQNIEDCLLSEFQKMDLNSDGFLDAEEIFLGTQKAGMEMSHEEVTALVEIADENKDGHISYKEWINLQNGMNAEG